MRLEYLFCGVLIVDDTSADLLLFAVLIVDNHKRAVNTLKVKIFKRDPIIAVHHRFIGEVAVFRISVLYLTVGLGNKLENEFSLAACIVFVLTAEHVISQHKLKLSDLLGMIYSSDVEKTA